MRSMLITLVLAAAVVSGGSLALAEPAGKALSTPNGTTRIALEADHISVEFIESDEGMVLNLKSNGVEIRSRRIYLGDGKVAAKFEATLNGIDTPAGLVNAAGMEIRSGTVMKVPAARLEKWAADPNGLYIKTPGIQFESVAG